MKTKSPFSTAKGGSRDISKDSPTSERCACNSCCDIDIHIDNHGEVNIYNCSAPSGTGTTPPSTCPPCFPPVGACLPVVPGAKHKLSREYKLAKLADRV